MEAVTLILLPWEKLIRDKQINRAYRQLQQHPEFKSLIEHPELPPNQKNEYCLCSRLLLGDPFKEY
jgi:hypothetical protein